MAMGMRGVTAPPSRTPARDGVNGVIEQPGAVAIASSISLISQDRLHDEGTDRDQLRGRRIIWASVSSPTCYKFDTLSLQLCFDTENSGAILHETADTLSVVALVTPGFACTSMAHDPVMADPGHPDGMERPPRVVVAA